MAGSNNAAAGHECIPVVGLPIVLRIFDTLPVGIVAAAEVDMCPTARASASVRRFRTCLASACTAFPVNFCATVSAAVIDVTPDFVIITLPGIGQGGGGVMSVDPAEAWPNTAGAPTTSGAAANGLGFRF